MPSKIKKPTLIKVNEMYCEKDSDCTTQQTVTSRCCSNAYPQIVTVYQNKQTEVVCSAVGCTDHYFICPKFEIKCIASQCVKLDS